METMPPLHFQKTCWKLLYLTFIGLIVIVKLVYKLYIYDVKYKYIYIFNFNRKLTKRKLCQNDIGF